MTFVPSLCDDLMTDVGSESPHQDRKGIKSKFMCLREPTAINVPVPSLLSSSCRRSTKVFCGHTTSFVI